jgi:two-component system response regulator FixJ
MRSPSLPPKDARRSQAPLAAALASLDCGEVREPEVQIIDDDVAIRRSIGLLLGEAGIAAHGYASALDFLDDVHDLGPGCIITALRMPEIDGFELMTQLKVRGVRKPVIIISGYSDIPMAVQAMRAGAQNFIEKPLDGIRLLAAVRAAISSDAQARRDPVAAPGVGDLLAMLTPREGDVLHGVVAGKANKLIARELGISPRTVEAHRAGVMAKTGASSVSALMRLALLAGL